MNKLDMCCVRPSVCPFIEYCTEKEFPKKNSLMHLNGISFYRKVSLKWRGITNYHQLIDENILLPEKSFKQIELSFKSKPFVNKKEIGAFLREINAKKFIWFLDFEYINVIQPIGQSKKGFLRLPYIFSLYAYDTDKNKQSFFQYMLPGALNSVSLRVLLKKLISYFDLNKEAPIIVSDISKAKESISNLAACYPEQSEELLGLVNRMKDIRKVFVDQWYYHPKFEGSSYMKDIAKVVCPEIINYNNLVIGTGSQALNAYYKMVYENQSNLQEAIKQYSQLDAFTLLSVYDFLGSLI